MATASEAENRPGAVASDRIVTVADVPSVFVSVSVTGPGAMFDGRMQFTCKADTKYIAAG